MYFLSHIYVRKSVILRELIDWSTNKVSVVVLLRSGIFLRSGIVYEFKCSGCNAT